MGGLSGEGLEPVPPNLPLVDSADPFLVSSALDNAGSVSSRSRPPLCASPPDLAAEAKKPALIQDSSSYPSLSFPAAAPQSGNDRFGTRLGRIHSFI